MAHAATLLILIFAASTARAQEPPAGTTPAFVVQSDNGDNRLQIGGFVHVDGRFAVQDRDDLVTDTFLVRRLRTVTQGRLARHMEFYLNVDLAGNAVNVRDAYFDTRFSDAFRVRVGKFKAPFSYDRLILVSSLLFVERGLTTQIASDRDVGIQVLGDLHGAKVSYAAAVTNGTVDGGSVDSDPNESKDVTGRVVLKPWVGTSSSLSGFGVAAAASTGTAGGALPWFQTAARQVFFAYQNATGVGRRTRWSPQAFFYRGPFGAYAELVRSRGHVQREGTEARIDHDGWEITSSWVLTGEAAGERNVRPAVNFDPPSGHWGAVQVAARYHQLHVGPEAVANGFAAPGASVTARAFTVGLNWYLNPFVKWNLNLERTSFPDGPAPRRPAETAILLRAHFGF